MQSMTGFGQGTAKTEAFEINVEITGVNHKSRDIRFSLPPTLQSLEPDLTRLIADKIYRGMLNVSLGFLSFDSRGKSRLVVDSEIMEDLCNQVTRLTKQFDAVSVDAGTWLNLPGVVTVVEPSLDRNDVLQCASLALEQALETFKAERKREGDELAKDLKQHHAHLCSYRDDMCQKAGTASAELYKRFMERIDALGLELTANDERVAKELALMVQKADITEELVRLQAHLVEFGRLLDENNVPVGRKLQFLCQEIHREINTLGSKTSEADISLLSLNFKTELDRLREQVLNIE